MPRSALAIAFVALLVGCGERERTLEDVPFTPPITVDTAGSTFRAQRQADSIFMPDTLEEADSVVVDAFPSFLREFQTAVRAGALTSVSSMVRFQEGGLDANTFEENIFSTVFQGEMGDRFLGVRPSDFERAGTERRITLHVGYDREGNVVLPAEAYTETTATLMFDETTKGYRLVRVDLR